MGQRHLLIGLLVVALLGVLLWTLLYEEEEAASPVALAPAPPMESVVPDGTTIFAWGDGEFLSWEKSLSWLPDAQHIIRVCRKELTNLGTPMHALRQIGMGMRIVDGRAEWFLILDGGWKAEEVFGSKVTEKGAAAQVDVGGTPVVRVREGVFFFAGGSDRIITGSEAAVRSLISVMKGEAPSAAERLATMTKGLADAPLTVALLDRYHYIPGLASGAFRLRLTPRPYVEGNVWCVANYEGCSRLEEKIYLYSELLKGGSLPDGMAAFLDSIRLELGETDEHMHLVSSSPSS